MVQRLTPEQFYSEVDNKLLYLGIIVMGVVACVAIVALFKGRK